MTRTQRPFKHRSVDRAFLSISAVAVAIAIVAGFWLLGSPGQQRLRSLDSERINDLIQITSDLSYTIDNPGSSTPALPLPEQPPNSMITRPDLTDPVTHEPYEYRRLSDSSYELCATFATDSSEQNNTQPTSIPSINARWSHPAGRHCFEIARSTAEPKP